MNTSLPNQETFERAAEFFSVLSTPVRLRIIGELCQSERNVKELLGCIPVSQPNMSRHLNVLYMAGVVGKRKSGTQVYYRIANDKVLTICQTICTDA